MMFRTQLALATGFAIGTLVVSTAAVAQDSITSETPTPSQTATLTAAERNLLSSGGPVNVVLDPNTGDVLSVVASDPGRSSASTG